jgi:hypothetical protein
MARQRYLGKTVTIKIAFTKKLSQDVMRESFVIYAEVYAERISDHRACNSRMTDELERI